MVASARRGADSRTPLREAARIFDALGMLRYADRARRELRASGERARRRVPEAWTELSPQELQIAQLAAEGLSNRDIGERLYLSHRTVSTHLHRLFPKLGITSRTQLAAFCSRRTARNAPPSCDVRDGTAGSLASIASRNRRRSHAYRSIVGVDQLRSSTERAPFATSVQGQVLIKGVDIEQTLVIAEQELKRGRFASVLTLWGIRDQVYTEAQAQRVSYLYFQYIDTRKDYFNVWHFTWAISNIYRNGNAAVRAELELAYQDAKERAKAAGGWADGLANSDILMGDIHPPARHFVQTHVVAPGTSRYLQSLEDYRPFRTRP